MRPKSDQLARLYATAQAHKLNDLKIVERLKFRSTVDQTCTATYGITKVIGEDLEWLACNKYKISDCLKFPDTIKLLTPLQKNKE